MNNRYNLSNLEALFRDYLKTCSISKVSIKNYACDLKHFISWFMYSRIGTEDVESHLDVFIGSISKNIVEDYVKYLQKDSIPILTINRRLSTLRKFFTFCLKREILQENPILSIKNIEKPALKRGIKEISVVEVLFKQEKTFEEDFIEFIQRRGEKVDNDLLEDFRLYIK